MWKPQRSHEDSIQTDNHTSCQNCSSRVQGVFNTDYVRCGSFPFRNKMTNPSQVAARKLKVQPICTLASNGKKKKRQKSATHSSPLAAVEKPNEPFQHPDKNNNSHSHAKRTQASRVPQSAPRTMPRGQLLLFHFLCRSRRSM